ncbi:MAG: DUF177 domain-containing protein [Desulfosarcina sp.]|nr:DUF177 domain-containing protein [Desulfobacterales bacterium]
MRIRIHNMPAAGMTLADTLEAVHLPQLMALTQQGGCLFHAPVDVRLHISPTAGMYRVEGELHTTIVLTCSRCLEAFGYSLDSHFHVTYRREMPGSEEAASETRELRAEEMGLVPFDGEEIDFRDMLQEQIILSIPMQPKCRADCEGLCARCGANLNQAACNCQPEAVDPRLAVLKDLKLDH